MVIFISVIHFIYLWIAFFLGYNLKIFFFPCRMNSSSFQSQLFTLYYYIWLMIIFVYSFILLTWILLNIPKLVFSSQVELVVKNLPANAGYMKNMGLIPGLERYPGRVHGNPLQYCLENCYGQRTRWWLKSIELQRVRHDWNDLASMHTCTQTCPPLKKRILIQLADSHKLEDKNTVWKNS